VIRQRTESAAAGLACWTGALYGVLAEIETLGVACSRPASSLQTANHQNQATSDHRDGY
jgi:hypothetical protein